MKVSVLGTDYEIKEDKSILDMGCDGLCKSYNKEILVIPAKDMLCPEDDIEIKEKRYREVIRHELIHAFFFESGLNDYSANEQLVDFLAMQIPKMNAAFNMLEVGDR